MYVCLHVSGTCRGQKGVTDSLGLQLKMAVSPHWELGTECGSCVRAASIVYLLNH